MKNHIAKDLRTSKYKKRIEKSKKGKGSYSRKTKGAKKLPSFLLQCPQNYDTKKLFNI